MKTLIVYAGRQGTTHDCAKELRSLLEGEVTLANAREGARAPEGYGRVVIASSVRAGMMDRAVKRYAKQHEAALLQTRLGLFVCCAQPSPAQEKYLRDNLPAAVVDAAAVTASFGGEYRFERMGVFERWLLKKIQKSTGVTPQIDHDAIAAFAKELEA